MLEIANHHLANTTLTTVSGKNLGGRKKNHEHMQQYEKQGTYSPKNFPTRYLLITKKTVI